MVDRNSNFHELKSQGIDGSLQKSDLLWLAHRLDVMEKHLVTIEQQLASREREQTVPRQFYSVQEFAELVDKREYTVREWCRLCRIHAEKSDSGHGETTSWKIPAEELARYRDHGLLPRRY